MYKSTSSFFTTLSLDNYYYILDFPLDLNAVLKSKPIPFYDHIIFGFIRKFKASTLDLFDIWSDRLLTDYIAF